MGKRQLLEALLRQSSVYLRIDGRQDGVSLPDWLKTDPSVVLQLGYDLAIPIPDLTLDDEGVQATLSFRRTPHLCRVPWRAIYAMSDEEGHQAVFPEDIPQDLLANPPEPPPGPQGDKGPPGPSGSGPSSGGPSSGGPSGPSGKKPRPSHLKLVK